MPATEPGRVGRLLPAAFRSRLDLEPPDPEPAVEEAGSAFTLRAFALGTFLAAFIGGGVAYSTLYLHRDFVRPSCATHRPGSLALEPPDPEPVGWPFGF